MAVMRAALTLFNCLLASTAARLNLDTISISQSDHVKEMVATMSTASASTNDSANASAERLGCLRKTYQVENLVAEAKEWCDPHRVNAAFRVPEKLQGLFWMQNNIFIPDVMVCMSLGWWFPATRTLFLHAFEAFVWMNNVPGALGQLLTAGNFWMFQFSEKLDKADLHPFSFHLPGMAYSWFLDATTEMPMLEEGNQKRPGDDVEAPDQVRGGASEG